MDVVLNEDDLSDVYDILHSVRAQWQQIGLQLNVIPAELDAMQSGSGTQDPLMRMLRYWLRNAPHPTWPDIVEALRRPSVNRPNIAERVRQKYCPWYEPQPPSLTSPVPLQPVADVEGELRAALHIATSVARALARYNNKLFCGYVDEGNNETPQQQPSPTPILVIHTRGTYNL